MTVWVNGRLLADDAPAVSGCDHGLTVGDGVFETAKVVRGVPFALGRHLRRLAASAAGLHLPVDLGLVRQAVAETLAAEPPLPLGRLRITVTGGRSPLSSERGPGPVTLIVAQSPVRPWPPTATVVVLPWPRNERAATAGLKTTSYADNVLALDFAHERGADEAIFGNTVGQLCEGTGSNVFLVRDGRLVTPSRASGCLAGITRELLLEWVPDAVEQDLPLGALADADEAFLTSSTRDVLPIGSVDDRVLTQAPGPVTAAVARTFAERAALDPDP